MLDSVMLGVVTSTVPVVAPAGTVVVISDAETTVNVAAVPLKVTPVAPFNDVPRILTLAPSFPDAGSVSTNALAPIERLKNVPAPLAPPDSVVPYKIPLVCCTKPELGVSPSVHPLCAQKL